MARSLPSRAQRDDEPEAYCPRPNPLERPRRGFSFTVLAPSRAVRCPAGDPLRRDGRRVARAKVRAMRPVP